MSAPKKNYTVIICSYNKLEHLKITSKRIQDIRPENEIILSDDCSSDNTIEWAKQSKIFSKIYKKEKREPYCLCSIRNEGIKMSTNSHVVFLDADCYIHENYFIGHDEIFNINQNYISVGFTDHFNSDGNKIILEDTRKSYLNGKYFCEISYHDAFGGNIAFPKEVFNKIGLFDESFNGFWGYEDLDMAYRSIKSGFKLFMHIFTLVKHLEHPISRDFECSNIYGRNYNYFKNKHSL